MVDRTMETFLDSNRVKILCAYRKEGWLPGYCFDLADAIVLAFPGQWRSILFEKVQTNSIDIFWSDHRTDYYIRIFEGCVSWDIAWFGDDENTLIKNVVNYCEIEENDLNDCVGKIRSIIPKHDKL